MSGFSWREVYWSSIFSPPRMTVALRSVKRLNYCTKRKLSRYYNVRTTRDLTSLMNFIVWLASSLVGDSTRPLIPIYKEKRTFILQLRKWNTQWISKSLHCYHVQQCNAMSTLKNIIILLPQNENEDVNGLRNRNEDEWMNGCILSNTLMVLSYTYCC